MSRKKMLCMIALVGGAMGAYQHAQAQQKMVVFGDSFSDTGLVWRALAEGTGENLPVSPPYFEGRFSNGPVAVEHMASQLGMSLDGRAWGGALTREGNILGSQAGLGDSGLPSQVRRYVAEQAGRPLDADTLHFIWAGANDLIFGPNATTARQASARVAAQVDTLYAAGARSFFVPLMPDLSRAPMLASDPAEGDNRYRLASVAFNEQLMLDLGAARARHADAHIVHFDTMAYLGAWLDGPDGEALEQVQACVDGSFYQVDAVCADPGRHVYWDGTHFTEGVHERLGQAFATAVPEPASMALMGWGLVAVSLMLRRVRRLNL